MACEGRGEFEGARIVLFADSSFFTNEYMQRARANLPLFTNAINWLAARETQLDIGPKVPYESRVDILPEEAHRIAFYVLLVIPGAAALLGVVVWWFRRR